MEPSGSLGEWAGVCGGGGGRDSGLAHRAAFISAAARYLHQLVRAAQHAHGRKCCAGQSQLPHGLHRPTAALPAHAWHRQPVRHAAAWHALPCTYLRACCLPCKQEPGDGGESAAGAVHWGPLGPGHIPDRRSAGGAGKRTQPMHLVQTYRAAIGTSRAVRVSFGGIGTIHVYLGRSTLPWVLVPTGGSSQPLPCMHAGAAGSGANCRAEPDQPANGFDSGGPAAAAAAAGPDPWRPAARRLFHLQAVPQRRHVSAPCHSHV